MTQLYAATVDSPDWASHVHVEELALPFPFWRYSEALRDSRHSFLLDSAADPENLGRHSFLGADPYLVFRAWHRCSTEHHRGAEIEIEHWRAADGTPLYPPRRVRILGDPFVEMRRLLRGHGSSLTGPPGESLPFLAGAVGYFAYEAGRFIEDMPVRPKQRLDLPDVCFLFVDAVLAHSHLTGRSFLSVLGRGHTQQASRDRALSRAATVRRQISDWEIRAADRVAHQTLAARNETPAAGFPDQGDKAGYCRLVELVLDHIAAGDVYEVCLSRCMDGPFSGDAWCLYRELRRINPAPFACFLNLPEVQVVSASPERFLRLDRDGRAESRPIKGTRPRGETAERDTRLRRELVDSAKDRAENIMIVDLVRNDFGRVCEPGSIHVPELMRIEDYATVFQMVSTVRGRLRDGLDALDLVQACFPGGSMTGAPKIKAMKIIDRLEPVSRGVYSGAMGYLDHSGTMDLSMVIRTIILKDGRAYVHTGGAIVADSDPADEYAETHHKAVAPLLALKRVMQLRPSATPAGPVT